MSCARGNYQAQNPQIYKGAAVGSGIGSIAGGLIDRRNRWRGASIGGMLGGLLGSSLAAISSQARHEAVDTQQPVQYQSKNGWERIQAMPIDYDEKTHCHKVSEKHWQGGRLVDDRISEVCNGDRTQYRY